MIKEKGVFTITPIQVILVSKFNLRVLSNCASKVLRLVFLVNGSLEYVPKQ